MPSRNNNLVQNSRFERQEISALLTPDSPRPLINSVEMYAAFIRAVLYSFHKDFSTFSHLIVIKQFKVNKSLIIPMYTQGKKSSFRKSECHSKVAHLLGPSGAAGTCLQVSSLQAPYIFCYITDTVNSAYGWTVWIAQPLSPSLASQANTPSSPLSAN